MKKADPYVVIKIGKTTHKSKTVHNNQNPSWNFKVAEDILEATPRQITFEVFDDDIGDDATLGNATIDMHTIMNKEKLDNMWLPLNNCKSGEILISAVFIKALVTEGPQHEIKEVKNEETVVAKKQSHTGSQNIQQRIELVDPLYQDDEFIVVEKKNNKWFMVVSPHSNLPINVNLVPFKQTSSPNSPIYIYPLPRGGFHNIKRVVHSGKGLRKCGVEKSCVLRPGEPYTFWAENQNKSHNLGTIRTDTWGPDRSWVECGEIYAEKESIEVVLSKEGREEPVFSGAISLHGPPHVEAA